jgi:hypothetical protein
MASEETSRGRYLGQGREPVAKTVEPEGKRAVDAQTERALSERVERYKRGESK